jgi:phosphatidylethanolamine N-methyltransferase
MDKVLDGTFDFMEDFLDAARPKLASGVTSFVQDTKSLFQKYPARITITRLEPEVVGLNPKDYSLEVEGTPASPLVASQRSSNKESELGRTPAKRTNDYKPLLLD